MVTNSILDTVKQMLGLTADYDVYDSDIVVHINSAIAVLAEIGAAPEGLFVVDDTLEWSALSTDPKILNHIKSYVYISVKMLFDPPASSIAMEAMKSYREELTWRLEVAAS